MKTNQLFTSQATTRSQTVIFHPGTRTFLKAGIIAGPLYISVALIQALTRPGFDLLHHDVSLLSNGDLGWIQILNFLVSGLLVILSAIGLRRAIPAGRGKTWGPILIGLYGLGLIGAGIFVADPMAGFPPGTPANANTISINGLLHFVTGGLGFLALIAACFVFARRFAGFQQRSWSVYSVATGLIFFAAFLGIASGSGEAWRVIGFWVGVVVAWTWIALLCSRFLSAQTGEKV